MTTDLTPIQGREATPAERDYINTIVDHISSYDQYRDFIQKLINAYEGQLTPMVRESMKVELSATTYEQAKGRVPSFNLLRKIVTKLSKVYNEPAKRVADKEADQEPVEHWEQSGQFDAQLAHANAILNLCKGVAIEPYTTPDGRVGLRVMAPNLAMPYSDDPYDPSHMTAMIKMVRHRKVPYTADYTDMGENNDPQRIGDEYLYEVWTNDKVYTFVQMYKNDRTVESIAVRENTLGLIPFVWVKRSQNYLIPEPDMDLLETAILIPKIYADLSYAVMFNSFGMLATVDLDVPDTMTKSPNQVWALHSSEAAQSQGKQGKITPMKAEVDIDEVSKFAANLAIMALESRNIKAGSMGKTSEQRASGAAKVVDNADVSEDVIQQQGLFAAAEAQLWPIIVKLHESNLTAIKSRSFSPNFKLDVRFAAHQIVTTFDAKLSYVERQLALGLMSKRQAIQTLRPELTEDFVDKWLEEAEEDAEKNLLEVMQGAQSGKSTGQFTDRNQSAGGQNVERGAEKAVSGSSANDKGADAKG
jgi:hypothetical protein